MEPGGPPAAAPPSGAPDPEVTERPSRRQYSAEYKLRILREADLCSAPGEIGALLRREGLYSSHLITWRRQRDAGTLSALGPKPRGPKPKPDSAAARRLAQLEAENRRLRKGLEEANLIIEYQKKTLEIVRIPLNRTGNADGD